MTNGIITNVVIAPSPGGGTSSNVDTTGANFLVAETILDFALTQTFTDSKSNTWINLSGHATGGTFAKTNLFYCINPVVGSGHNFTVGATTGTPSTSGCVAAFKVITAFDTQTAGTGNASSATIQGGSITPAAKALIISGVGWGGPPTATHSIDGGFTITDQVPNVLTYACGLAYLFQNSPAAVNPTWTLSEVPSGQAAVNYSFLLAADGTARVFGQVFG